MSSGMVIVETLTNGDVKMSTTGPRLNNGHLEHCIKHTILLHPEQLFQEALTLLSIATGIDPCELDENLQRMIQRLTASKSEREMETEEMYS